MNEQQSQNQQMESQGDYGNIYFKHRHLSQS